MPFHLSLFWDAFLELRRGAGDNEIPWHWVSAWCDEHGLEGQTREDVRHHVTALDAELAQWRAEQRQKG